MSGDGVTIPQYQLIPHLMKQDKKILADLSKLAQLMKVEIVIKRRETEVGIMVYDIEFIFGTDKGHHVLRGFSCSGISDLRRIANAFFAGMEMQSIIARIALTSVNDIESGVGEVTVIEPKFEKRLEPIIPPGSFVNLDFNADLNEDHSPPCVQCGRTWGIDRETSRCNVCGWYNHFEGKKNG